jgi:hypothetical protein
MRKFLIPLLLASVVMPAAAYARPDNDGPRRERSAEQKDRSSEDRPQRAEHANRSERAVKTERVERVERPVRLQRVERTSPQQQVQVRQVQSRQEVRRVRRSDRNLVDGIREVAREGGSDGQIRRDRDGSFTGVPSRTVERHVRTPDRRWSNDWRRDHRYDWRNYRNSHRSIFRLGRYYDPYGWGYRRFSIGFSLGSSYYGSNYWLDDPWMYRLPPAYGPYRWVRYYDDALLVNIYSGQVVDVLYNFFW